MSQFPLCLGLINVGNFGKKTINELGRQVWSFFSNVLYSILDPKSYHWILVGIAFEKFRKTAFISKHFVHNFDSVYYEFWVSTGK